MYVYIYTACIVGSFRGRKVINNENLGKTCFTELFVSLYVYTKFPRVFEECTVAGPQTVKFSKSCFLKFPTVQ